MTNKVAIQWLKGMRKTCVRLSPEIKALDLAIKALEERPHGEWINTFTSYAAYECSCCGLSSPEVYDFCPNCGAKMEKGGAV